MSSWHTWQGVLTLGLWYWLTTVDSTVTHCQDVSAKTPFQGLGTDSVIHKNKKNLTPSYPRYFLTVCPLRWQAQLGVPHSEIQVELDWQLNWSDVWEFVEGHRTFQFRTFGQLFKLRLVTDQPTVSGISRAAETNSLLHQIPMMTTAYTGH